MNLIRHSEGFLGENVAEHFFNKVPFSNIPDRSDNLNRIELMMEGG